MVILFLLLISGCIGLFLKKAQRVFIEKHLRGEFMRFRIVKRELEIGKQINELTEQILEAGMLCRNGVDAYLKGNLDVVRASLICIRDTEKRWDMLRRSMEEALYRNTLIPQSCTDVMKLLESMNVLLNQFKDLISQLEIECPDICAEFHQDLRKLLEYSVEAVEADIRSCRAFFNNMYSVSDHIHKVFFWEKESDKVSARLQRAIFSNENIDLSHKMHLHFFVKQIARIVDDAENVADRLNIYVNSRMT